MERVNSIFKNHGLITEDIGLTRPEDSQDIEDVHFEPKDTGLSEPKEGVHDDEEHSVSHSYPTIVQVLICQREATHTLVGYVSFASKPYRSLIDRFKRRVAEIRLV